MKPEEMPPLEFFSAENVTSKIGAVWDQRCGTHRNPAACETCTTLTDLCEELGIEPPPPNPRADG